MTLAAQMAADVSAVLLNTDEIAESWTHRPLGVAANDTAVTVVPNEPDADRRTDHGRHVEHERVIYLASGVSCDTADQWLDADSVKYETLSVGHVEAGLRKLKLRRMDDESINDGRMVL